MIVPQRCKPAGYGSWDFKQEEQKNVIYGSLVLFLVSNLPAQLVDKPKLRKIFESVLILSFNLQCGKIEEIRLTIRNGISFAYIDFLTQVLFNSNRLGVSFRKSKI
jgi:hypothetical protein